MTKKPSEKNKTWEKDRRDRLNKTFDELAKLLPKFDPSVVWSKIEIIQKAIAFIADLEKRLEDYLEAKDPALLKEYKEFVSCLRFYQERNAQLTELLKKAKVTLPPVILPQLLVDKPELLPKENNVEADCLQKPKRPRNRTKKSDAIVVAKEPQESKELKKEPGDITSNNGQVPVKLVKAEVIVKPTAVITAFSREIHEEPPKEPTPHLPSPPPPPPPLPPVPAKSLLVRIQKIRKNYQLIPRPTFRKCYPHPTKMLRWSIDAISQRKLLTKRRRQAICPKKKLRKQKKSPKGVKVELSAGPMREQSVSPTAAFLLSFPVVTSSMLSGKNVENAESSVSLENLNNFFTTEEYSKFCDQNTVVEEKILSPIPVCSADNKPLISGKPMTVFTVSSITRPATPKKATESVNRNVRAQPIASFESCYGLNNINSAKIPTSVCAPNSQQVTHSQFSSTNSVSTACFPSPASTEVKQFIKLEQMNPNCTPTKSDSYGKFFPRYNHSATSSLRAALETPSKVSKPAPVQQKASNPPSSASNWPAKTSTPIGKSISHQATTSVECKTNVLTTKPSTVPFIYSPTKNFFYDFPPQNQQTIVSATADPMISSTAAVKSRPIKTEFPWIPPNKTIATATCNQNTPFTPFDLATIVGDTLTSTSFTFSLTTPKSSDPTVVEAGNKTTSTSKCNQMNLFLPYEEGQYTPAFTFSLTKPTESQGGREVPWKPLEKPKDTTDQIFYDCEQSKPQQKAHVNWMTSPTTDYTPASASALPLPPIDFGNQFPGSSTNFDFSFGCRKDSYDDENQFINWSPTKPLTADFSAAYSFENFGSNEAPPNKTVKQIFSVSQLVDQTPSHDSGPSIKKTAPKSVAQKNPPAKQSFSNTYSAESLIAKKDNTRFYNPTDSNTTTNTQTDYHSSSGYYFNYPNAQTCPENDYLGAGTYVASSTLKTASTHQPAPAGVSTGTIPSTFDSNATAQTTTNYFAHTISSNNNDPYDPTYFPSSNYNQSWNQQSTTMKAVSSNIYNQSQYGAVVEPSCQQNSNVSSNLTNFNLSSICPEIDGKDGPGGW